MEIKDDLVGQFARLPDGQKVKIEIVYEDGQATVRRVAGKWRGMVAVCAVASLLSPTPKPEKQLAK